MKILSFCCLLLLASCISAQAVLNVKIGTQVQDLQDYCRQNEKKVLSTQDLATQKGLFPFFANLHYIEGLQAKAIAQKGNPSEIAGVFTLHFESGNTQSHLLALQQSGLFAFVEENRKLTLDALTTSNDDSISAQWHHPKIQTFTAWDITRGSNAIKIGVIDTGLDYKHPEFKGQLAINGLEDINGNGTFEPWAKTEIKNGKTGDFDGIDQDGNGYADDVIGYDFTDEPLNPIGGDYLYQDADPADEQSHGTFVSGIIVAKADNQIGGAGIAPNCKLVTLRAFDASGNGEDDDAARAIVYAADNGVNVLNLSFGNYFPSLMMREAIRYAYTKGVVIVASAGNAGGDNLHYPSGFDETISVSATALGTTNEYLWQFSNYGLWTSLTAPGSNIFSTTLRDSVDGKWVEYMRASGTSASAPMVSGAAALLLSQRPTLTPAQVRSLLENGCDDVMDAGWDHFTGAGRLNILRSLQITGNSNVQILLPRGDTGKSSDSLYITGTVIEPKMKNYSLEYQAGIEGGETWIPILTNQNFQVAEDTLALWNLAGLAEGDYTIRLRLEKSDGFTIEDRVRFVRDKSAPQIDIRVAHPIWFQNERQFYVAIRASDRGIHKLHYRKQGETIFKAITFDRITFAGEFLLGKENLSNGSYEYYISTQNQTGLVAQSPIQSFDFQAESIDLAGFNELKTQLPMGAYLPKSYDFDNDGQKEIVMSEYGKRLNYGKIKFYEYGLTGFAAVDSLPFKNVLIPKNVADADGDGQLDLLSSVNDSTFITSKNSKGFPTNITWTRTGNGLYAARFGDTDDDGTQEILLKNFKDYYVFKKNGNDYTQNAQLIDTTGNYQGSIAPRALVGDFDGDSRTEIVYGGYDGDFIIYEHNPAGGYEVVFMDTTDIMYKAGEYLAQGDFDGDGKQEIFVATHPIPGLRNADNEYDPTYIHLRIFEANANNSYQKVWEDYLYDIDSDEWTAATVGNIDADAKDELIFSSFPKTFILEHDNGNYHFSWFFYGHLTTHHVVGDFNGNGIAEFGVGRGDSTIFYEKDFNFQGPKPVTTLTGIVLGANQTQLSWEAVSNATTYTIVRQENVPNAQQVILGSTTSLQFIDNQSLIAEKEYLYAVFAENPALTPTVSEVGNVILLQPHLRNQIDSIKILNDKQLLIYFSEKMEDREADKARFLLNTNHNPITTIGNGKTMMLAFDTPFSIPNNMLKIDTSLLDARRGLLFIEDSLQSFLYQPDNTSTSYLTHWERIDEKNATLYFNLSMKDEVLDIQKYTIAPFGNIANIEWADATRKAIKVQIDNAVLANMGYSVSITVQNVSAQDGSPIRKGEGNTATFTGNQAENNEAYAYPNPYNAAQNTLFEGIHFANLTQKATISIYTASGRYVNTIQEADGDGGVLWDLKDQTGQRIKAGVYVFKVVAEGQKDFLGKFSVVE